MQTVEYSLPAHWVHPLEYGPEGYEAMDAKEIKEFERFCDVVCAETGQVFASSYSDDDGDFRRYHDATQYGVLACNVVTVTFAYA
jgi:hypothetical protein